METLFVKCKKCNSIMEKKIIKKNSNICINCGAYQHLTYNERIDLIFDKGTFVELEDTYDFIDPINFPDYLLKHEKIMEEYEGNDAIITGLAKLYEIDVLVGVMDTRYMMGSMGIIVGEKVTRLFECGLEKKLPIIIFTASGGARMQEGMYALLQMAKTSSAVARYREKGGLYISVLTNPTTGGVSASFAFLGDIIIAEPGALIGFAGKRVIEQTVKEELPKEFQTSEYLFDKGFIDIIVPRTEQRNTLGKLLKLHNNCLCLEV